jgi:hypothetical protein
MHYERVQQVKIRHLILFSPRINKELYFLSRMSECVEGAGASTCGLDGFETRGRPQVTAVEKGGIVRSPLQGQENYRMPLFRYHGK